MAVAGVAMVTMFCTVPSGPTRTQSPLGIRSLVADVTPVQAESGHTRGPLVLRSAFAHFDRGVEGITGCAPPVVFHIPARVGDRMILRLETRVGANYLFRIDVTANLNGFWTQGGNGESGRELDFLRSEEHTSELQSRGHLVCRLLLEKK